MNDLELNDFIIEILQDVIELESMLKVLKDSACSERSEITMTDIGNTLEVIVAKISNTNISLNKYINITFNKE
jgi:hypothetical protein